LANCFALAKLGTQTCEPANNFTTKLSRSCAGAQFLFALANEQTGKLFAFCLGKRANRKVLTDGLPIVPKIVAPEPDARTQTQAFSARAQEHAELWQRLLAHAIGPPAAVLSFTARLARENGWSMPFAQRAVHEYRKFCFLAVTTEDAPAGEARTHVTPSHAVDQVWHLHLSYTRDYWQQFCPNVLGCTLHHGPTAGGSAEAARYGAQYAHTLQRLERHFGAIDEAIWPGVHARFAQAPHMQMLDRRHVWVIQKPSARGVLGAVPVALGCAVVAAPVLLLAANRAFYDPNAANYLVFFLILMALAGLYSWLLPHWRTRGIAPSRVMTPVEVGMIADGFERAVSVAEVELLRAGVLRLGVNKTMTDTGVAAQLRTASAAHLIAMRRSTAVTPLNTGEERGWRLELQQHGLLMGQAALWRMRCMACAPWLLLCALDGVRWCIGVARDKPVGFVGSLWVVVALIAWVLARNTSRATPAAQVRLKMLTRNLRLKTAPTGPECALACGVFGVSALQGSEMGHYYQHKTPPPGGDGSSTGDGGCGSGDSGGSGCGGCGGGD
jgi:uncharacterized protein (TIGR04222 family)